MPAIDANRGASRRAVKRASRKPKPKPYTRPAPRSQPGPVSDRQRARTNRYKQGKSYRSAVKKTRQESIRNRTSPRVSGPPTPSDAQLRREIEKTARKRGVPTKARPLDLPFLPARRLSNAEILKAIRYDVNRKGIERAAIRSMQARRAARHAVIVRQLAPALTVLEQTTRPLHAVAAAAREDVRNVKKYGPTGVIGHGSLKAAARGIQNKDKSTFSDVLKEAGVKNKTVAGILGFAGDVVFDPLTHGRAGFASPAATAATTAARKAERSAVRSGASKAAGVKAQQAALRRGASSKAARQAGRQAARKNARRAGQRAGEQAAQGKATNNGLSVRFAGRDVPGVTRVTAAAKRAPRKVADKTRVSGRTIDRAQQRTRDAVRNLGSDFNPAIAPAGVDRVAYQAARRAARTARAGAQRGTYRAGQRAVAFRDAIGKKNYEQVIDAIETGTVGRLPKELKGPARALQQDFAKMIKAERRVGLKVTTRQNYIKHLRIADEDRRGAPSVGSKQVKPSFAKQRREGTIREKNAQQPGSYSTDVADIYLNRGAESAVARAKARLNQQMVKAGRTPEKGVPVKDQLRDNETLYKVDGANLVKVDPKSAEAQALMRRPSSKYVILNDKLVSRTRGTVGTAAERSTSGVFFDKAQGVWKLAATQVNPGYHVRNLAGEAQNAYLAADNVLVLGKTAAQAARALRQLGRDEDAARVLGGTAKDKGYRDFVRQAEDVGAVRAGQLGREVRQMLGSESKKSGALKARRATLSRKPARALQNVEDVFRLATYKQGIDKGLSPEKAMERASRNHFDYGDLTPLERTTLRRIAPFYTFSARNIPLQVRTLLSNPGKFAQYQKIREEFAKAFGVNLDQAENDSSEYEQRAAPIYVKIGGRTVPISLGPSGLPLTDLNEFPVSKNPAKQADEWMNRAMSLLTPAAKTPIELWANFSFFFRDQIEKDEGPLVPAPSWVSAIPKRYRDKLGIVPDYVDKRTGKKGWGAPAKVIYAASALPGPANFANRVSTQSERPGQDTKTKVVRYLGLSATPIDPVTNNINRLYEERGKVDKKLRALNQRGVYAANPTPEYTKLNEQSKALTSDIMRLRTKRGDKIQGGRKPKSGGFAWPDKSGGFSWPDK